MNRYFNPFVLILTSFVALTYIYAAARLTESLIAQVSLAIPFVAVWLSPILYWQGGRQEETWLDQAFKIVSFVSIGWLSFLFLFLISRDVLLLVSIGLQLEQLQELLSGPGNAVVWGLSVLTILAGTVRAARGPFIHEVDIPIEGLPAELDGWRIVQISDLHVGPTIRRSYVERVVQLANEQAPDLMVLTGDIVDGRVADLAPHVAPLARLAPQGRVYLALGNHDYYSGASAWTQHFETLGIHVLRNYHVIVPCKGFNVLVGGVLDPAVKLVSNHLRPDPQLALQTRQHGPTEPAPCLKLLLAHNPKIAPEAEKAGFDLQLSGHTHAGQFFPWNLVTRWVHSPHFAGLSRQEKMWVYVNTGTGSWGPPLRVGTLPELTVIRLRSSLTEVE
ncbi:MAG: metallophosphoesterase [Oligoflexus sp.]